MEFQFLPGLGNTYSGKIRAFVLQNGRRKNAREDNPQGEEARAKGKTSAHFDEVSSRELAFDASVQAEDKLPLVLVSPSSMGIDQNRVDPFQKSAMGRLSKVEQRLIDHYINGSLTQFGYQRIESYRPTRINYAWLSQDWMMILAMLQFGVIELSTQNPEGSDKSQIANYRGLCIREISHRIEAERNSPSDMVIHSVIGIVASILQIRFKNQEFLLSDELAIHIRGLRSILARRSQWNLECYHKCVQYDLIWHDIILHGQLSRGYTAFSKHLSFHDSPLGSISDPSSCQDEAKWDYNCTQEFIYAYQNFYNLATTRLSGAKSSSLTKKSIPQKIPHSLTFTDLFRPGTPAHALLHRPRNSGVCIDPITVLLYINILLWNFRAQSPAQMHELYLYYLFNFRRTDVDLQSGIELLLFALGTDMRTHAWASTESMALLVRMMSVVCRVSDKVETRLSETLLGFINATTTTARRRGKTREVTKGWMDPREMRMLVLLDLGYGEGRNMTADDNEAEEEESV